MAVNCNHLWVRIVRELQFLLHSWCFYPVLCTWRGTECMLLWKVCRLSVVVCWIMYLHESRSAKCKCESKNMYSRTYPSRPFQSMICVPLPVNGFQKSMLIIKQCKYLTSCSGDFILQDLILRTRSCGTGFITELSWLLHLHPTKMAGRKLLIPLTYQLRRPGGISGGPALQYFCMIHNRVGRCE